MTPQPNPPDPDPAPSARTRNASATRAAILQSALVAFTTHGYNGVGVREIARAAGVTAMLVNRYFGSKERLFTEVVDVVFNQTTVLTDELRSLSGVAARGMVAPEPRSADAFLLLLRSIGDPRATEILRRPIEERLRKVEGLLSGDHAHERASLFVSLLLGVRVMQHMLASPTLGGVAEVLAERLEALLDRLVVA